MRGWQLEYGILTVQDSRSAGGGDLVAAVAERMTSAVQALLLITADLKRQALLDNHALLNSQLQVRRSQLQQHTRNVHGGLRQIQQEMSASLQVPSLYNISILPVTNFVTKSAIAFMHASHFPAIQHQLAVCCVMSSAHSKARTHLNAVNCTRSGPCLYSCCRL